MKIHRYLFFFFVIMFGILAQNHIVYAGITATTCPADHPATTDPQVECEEPCPEEGEPCDPPTAPVTQWVCDGTQPLNPGTIEGPSIICVGVATSYSVVGASDNDTEKKQYRTVKQGTKDAECNCIGAGYNPWQDYVPSDTRTDTASPSEWSPSAKFSGEGSFKSDTPGTFQIKAKVDDDGIASSCEDDTPAWTPELEVKVVAVSTLQIDTSGGTLLEDPKPLPDDPTDTKVYWFNKTDEGFGFVSASPSPTLGDTIAETHSSLPACWTFTGGADTDYPKLSRKFPLTSTTPTDPIIFTVEAGTSKKRIKVYVVEVTVVVWEQDGGKGEMIDNNQPGDGNGFFPDRTTWNGDNQNTIKAVATIEPKLEGIPVEFKYLDVDDPSTDAIVIDETGAIGKDNFDKVTPSINSSPATTASEGEATIVFTVGWRPGDNYRIGASCKPGEVSKLQVDDVGLDYYVPSGNDRHLSKFMGRLSPMLTIWRKIYIEVDAMQSDILGDNVAWTNIHSATFNSATGRTLLKVDALDSRFAEDDHFENGYINISTIGIIPIVAFEANVRREDVYVAGDYSASGVNASGKNCKLYDDDYHIVAGNLQFKVAWLKRPDLSRLAPALKPAYVKPLVYLTTSSSGVTFVSNLEDTDQLVVIANGDRQFPASKASSYYWSSYLSSAFQETPGLDKDPFPDADTLGLTDIEDHSSLIFLETIRDGKGSGIVGQFHEQDCVVHEIGHSLSIVDHTDSSDGGVMKSETNVAAPSDREYSESSLYRIRKNAFK